MRAIRIMDSGLFTTIQDLGRYGYQRYGVSVSGAMDEFSVKIANKLVGNSHNEAVLETTLKGVNIEFLSDCVFAITGGECDITLNGNIIDTWRSYRAKSGDIIKMGICKEGMRNYLAFSGGIDVPTVMNSRSTDIRAGIGGINGKKIMTHDILHLSNHNSSRIPLKKFNEKYRQTYQNKIEIRVVLGQQADYFT
ncbi:MAG: biotin-dependent carboxyltransferase family protein, partial [Fusobacteriaceae bacterium]|nr:biotin-dependent carboxyltransferase family protein [Fusobacteriaceae bacterium]